MEYLEADIKPFKSCLQPTLYCLQLVRLDSQTRSVLFVKLEDGSFRQLSHPIDLFSTRTRLVCKVLVFAQPTLEQILEVELPRSKTATQFKLPFTQGTFTLSCRVLNTTQEEVTPAMMLTPLKHAGYDKFLEFRRKVKKLENITSPLNWQVAHRVRVVHYLQTYTYEMEDVNEVCIDASLDGQLSFELEEQSFVTPENRLSETIASSVVSLKQNSPSGSFEIAIKFSQYLILRFSVERVMTELKQQQGLMSLRVLQAPSSVVDIKVGLVDDRTNQIDSCPSLKSVTTENGKTYFDPEYFFLQRNLKSIERSEQQSLEAVDQLDKLTKAFPSYPHVKNQQLLPLTANIKYLCLMFKHSNGETESVKIPAYNLLVGLNSSVLKSQEGGIRFYMEINKTTDQPCSKKHRIFSLWPDTIWNAYLLPEGQSLSVKLLTNRTVLKADFKTASKDMAGSDKDVRRQLQKLDSRNQLEVAFQKGKFIVSKAANSRPGGGFKVIEPPTNLQPEGLIIGEALYNQTVQIQVCVDQDIVAFGSFALKDLAGEGNIIVPLQTTSKQAGYVYVVYRYKQRERSACRSAARLYRLAYSITTLNPNTQISYELHLTNLLKSTKQFRKKIEPEGGNHSSMKEIDFCVFSKTKEAEVQLLIRRRYYDDLTESYSYHEYLSKNISFNNNARITDSNFHNVTVSDGCYDVSTWEFFAEDTLQHITFQLQVGCLTDQVLDTDGKGSGYGIKLLPMMWSKLKEGFQRAPSSVNFEVISNRHSKNRNGLPKVKEVSYMNCMQFSLKANDYRDAISIMMDERYGYSKIYELIKLPVNISKNELDLQGESQYSLTYINIDGTQLLFLLKCFEGVAESSSDEDVKSQKSAKTVGKERQVKGDKRDNIDDFNKTTRLNDVLQLKTEINKVTLQNRKLVTKVVRLENNNSVLEQKLAEIKQIAERKKGELKYAIVARPTQDKFTDPSIEEAKEKKRRLYREVCGCGAKQPKYMGYCEDCLKELEKIYRLVYKQFEQKAKHYQSTFYRNMLRKEKIQMLEGKIKNVKDRLLMRQSEENARNESEQVVEERTLYDLREKLVELRNTSATCRIRIDGIIGSGSQLQQNLEEKINIENRSIFELVQKIEEQASGLDRCRRKKAQIDGKISSLSSTEAQ